MLYLFFSQHGKNHLQVPLNKSNTQIGRSPECDVVLAEPTISRLQCSIYQLEGSYFVKNLGKAKLKLNGQEIEGAGLTENDTLELEGWRIALKQSESHCVDETYVSDAGMQSTQVLHLSRMGQDLHYESLLMRVASPGEAIRKLPLKPGTNTVGKAVSCDIRLTDPYVSEVHAKILCEGGKISLYDMRSTNGSYLDGIKVTEAEMKEGSVCKLGNSELRLVSESHAKKISPLETQAFGPFIGQSRRMRELYAFIQQVAPSNAPVCILGESGTGKELVAQSLHELSGRKRGPWVAFNCGAIAKELIQSELFGHEKGAFTGALQQHQGVFEQAKGGTLFLDEIAELPLELQASLLRVLESGKIRRVGGNQEIAIHARILCATHQDLPALIAERKFREDLYFRLHVLPLHLPALRERKEDIPLLAEHFLTMFSPPGEARSIRPDALRFLEECEWRGNVRELRNAIQRAMILSKNESLEPADFSFLKTEKVSVAAFDNTAFNPGASTLLEKEKQFILEELQRQSQNKAATAKALGIAKSTLYEKLKSYNLA